MTTKTKKYDFSKHDGSNIDDVLNTISFEIGAYHQDFLDCLNDLTVKDILTLQAFLAGLAKTALVEGRVQKDY